MYDHIGLKVKDLAASRAFYTALLKPLGFVVDDGGTGFGPPGAPALWLYESKSAQKDSKGGGTHIAFTAKDRKAVAAFHAAGLKAGAKDNGAPGLREDYSPTYYAGFLLDPDGNNVEAVCLD
jgi:catechol 2,3-dioxygenase-like lactoylglutathione lyase family enzyme